MHYDVVVIGTGQAGVPLATRLASEGKTVLVAERGAPGGTCVNTGCTPTKTMMASARAAHVARGAARLGVHTGEVRVDLAAVVARKDGMVARWSASVRKHLGETPGLTFVAGAAKFVGPREVEVGGEKHSGSVVVINTGASTVVPELPGLETVPWLDSASVMKLTTVPRHLVILGGSYIACEFGQMFRRFGAEVTLVERDAHLISREDEAISEALEGVFRAEGIEMMLTAHARGVRRENDDVVLELGDGREVRGSHLMLAVGRRPNTDDLGCDRAGVKLDARGAVVVDEYYRSSADGVYAVGDVIGGPQFTHTSWDDHRLLYATLSGSTNVRARSERLIPYAVFTDPQVACVGLSEREAKKRGIPYEVATMPFGSIARAIEVDETAGVMKVLIAPKTERVLGAAIVGIEAGELIHEFVALMQAGASARAIVDAQHIHPTLAEGVQSLVMRLPRYALS